MELSQNISGKKVLVSMTGRVDSMVAAFLLKKQGMQVFGISIVTCENDLVSDSSFLPKCYVDDLDRVNSFCEKIGITLYATDAKTVFEANVLDQFVANRLTGRGNYSCLDCTKMRMQIIYNKMKELNFDYIATGHYAKISKNLNSNRYFIQACNDTNYDQSMLLSGLDQEILEHLFLPLGELKKSDVQKIAKSFDLNVNPSSTQKNYCFPKAINGKKIILDRAATSLLKEGEVYNLETETQPTTHSGFQNYYLTQKDFVFNINSSIEKGLEIVDFNFYKNSIVVGTANELTFHGTQLIRLKMSEGVDKSRPLNCYFKLDETRGLFKGILFFKNNESGYLDFDQKIYPILKNEALVIYDSNGKNAKVIGSGKVQHRGQFNLLDRVEEFRKKEVNESGDLVPVGGTKLFKF